MKVCRKVCHFREKESEVGYLISYICFEVLKKTCNESHLLVGPEEREHHLLDRENNGCCLSLFLIFTFDFNILKGALGGL